MRPLAAIVLLTATALVGCGQGAGDPDGALWVTTSNSDGQDQVLRVSPR